MELKNICLICLRSDRKLKVIPTAISDYHEKLIDFTDFTLPLKNHHYCSDCDYLLRKTYNFQQKCINAAKILENWINAKEKSPTNMLHLKLPPISLGMWTSKNNKVFNFTGADSLEEHIMIDDCVTVHSDVDTVSEQNVSENEFVENTIQPEQLFEVELTHDTGVSEKSFQNFNNIIDMLNEIYNNIPNLENNMPKLNENMPKLTNVSNDKTFVINTEEKNSEPIYLISNKDNKNDNIRVIKSDSEYPDDASFNSDKDCDDYLHSSPRTTIKKKIALDELANIDLSDEDYESNINKTTDRSPKEDVSMNNFISTERSLILKLESMDKMLDSICENWEVTFQLIDTVNAGEQGKVKIKNMTRKFLTERKTLHLGMLKSVKNARGIFVCIEHMNTDLDLIIEKCANTVEDYKSGLCGPKERLKAMFEMWGELRTEDGSVFDKDIIIQRLDIVNEAILKRLVNFMCGKTCLTPEAARILTNIQNKQLFTQYESTFDIEYLTTEKDKLEEFKRRKTYECYVEAKCKCEICYIGFKTEKHLENHRKEYHDESQGQFVCRICHVSHKKRKRLNAHMKYHNVVYKCKLCPLVTYYRDSMINHYEQHKGTTYQCGKCGNTYKSKSVLLTHHGTAHPTGNHVCTLCGSAYVTKASLRLHMMKKHQDGSAVPASGSGFSCEECTLIFPSEKAYLRHRRITHGDVQERKFFQRIIRHNAVRKVRVAKIRPGVCRVCNMAQPGGGWLKPHYKKMHPDVSVEFQYENRKKYLCDQCGAVYHTQEGLRVHSVQHSADARPFACDLCPKRFRTVYNVRNHRLYHFPPALVCQYCGKKWHTKSNLFNHVQLHKRTVRCYKCQYCQKGFYNNYSLTEHIKGVHHKVRRIRKRARMETDDTTYGKRRVTAVAKRVTRIASIDEASTDECSNEAIDN